MLDILTSIDLSFITGVIKAVTYFIHQMVGENEFASGLLIAGLGGFLMFLCRNIPISLWFFIVKHCTTSFEVNNQHVIYFQLAEFLVHQGFTKNSRYLKASNGRWGNEGLQAEIGYGNQLFWYNWYTPLHISVHKQENVMSTQGIIENLTIRKLGRNHKLFEHILNEIKKDIGERGTTKYYQADEHFVDFKFSQADRTFESIYLPEGQIEDLKSSLDTFINKESWFTKHHIPYQLGIFLHGVPGSGKTSLIKAIAAYLNRSITYVSEPEGFKKAMSKAVDNTIIVAEELDTYHLNNRDEEKVIEDHKADTYLNVFLNALDGLVNYHGRIIILTTNHLNRLDSAILRPGRIDFTLELGYLQTSVFEKMLQNFFPHFKGLPIGYQIMDEVSPAQVQNDILLGQSLEQIINAYKLEENR